MPNPVTALDAATKLPLPFLLTPQQGEAARTLLSYVVGLSLPSPDAQLLAVVVAIRAARGGVGNLTGTDLRALKLTDPHQAVAALRSLGWQVPDSLVDGDPDIPVAVTVPDLVNETAHPLPFGKLMRSRVSGWTTRTMAAKPVRKTSSASRLAALILAAHSSTTLYGELPPDMPEDCRAATPDLLGKGFLSELSGDRYRLDPAVRHLAGRLHEHADQGETERPARRVAERPQVSPSEWAQWKAQAGAALRRHAEAVEYCPVCALPLEQVASAFMAPIAPVPTPRQVRVAYGAWKEAHPDRGPLAAQFTVAFRTEHGHGPSYSQLCTGLAWDLPRSLRTFVVCRLLANEWLTDTAPVPWTLRPGTAAQAHGIVLPSRTPQTAR
ncbi:MULTISPECIES: hypothetical protein [unclassified Streptomyces]|uniref:hypothetical protein n=1 Tax=unclassified Streptomyces TaxID=2593676 RepID=UPI0027E3E58D|nr:MULTISPECIES: hypothetical protein [unclassified Streptomyces]